MPLRIFLTVVCLTLLLLPVTAQTVLGEQQHPVYQLLGERFHYDITFLWFDHIGEGSLRLDAGVVPGTFLVTMEARTLGAAAFFTRNRMEVYQTLMEIGPDRLLRPLWHRTRKFKGVAQQRKEMTTLSVFDYQRGTISYHKTKNQKIYPDEKFVIGKSSPQFDILTALYNLRLGLYGPLTQKRIVVPMFDHKGPQEIVIEPQPVETTAGHFFRSGDRLFRVLLDPEVFGTSSREILASFDRQLRPNRGLVKGVIGLGDLHGELRPF